jgi:hypothetical protein
VASYKRVDKMLRCFYVVSPQTQRKRKIISSQVTERIVGGGQFVGHYGRLEHRHLLCHNFARTICLYVFESVKPTGWNRRQTLE